MTTSSAADGPSLDATRLSSQRYLEAFDDELEALVGAAGDLSRDVPSCPGWTVRDLVSHVLGVYRHKVAALTADAAPGPREEEWGALADGDDPVAELRAAHAELRALLVGRPSDAPTWSWWPPEQTVGFWQRRMAHETSVHRWDAEAAAHGIEEAAPIDADLAADGVDEVLGWLTYPWPDDEAQDGADGRQVLVSTGEHDWTVTLHPTRYAVSGGRTDDAVALVAAEPSTLVLHLWGRPVDGVATTGDLDALDLMRARLAGTTD